MQPPASPTHHSRTFTSFFDSEKWGGLLLVVCALGSLVAANSPIGAGYVQWWHTSVAGLTLQHWVNDALMAVFFLLVGLELERELYNGELSNIRNALLPVVAAAGGVGLPAAIHFAMNAGTATQAGTGIPMATDIAFALAVLALLGSRVPASLKIFLTALAVMDDLAAIAVIAVFYTSDLSAKYLAGALGMFVVLVVLNRYGRLIALAPYVAGGVVMWFLFLKSGVHATIAGVLLAFAIPFSARSDDEVSPSHRLEHVLHTPAALLVLPIFALANMALPIGSGWAEQLASANSIGIIAGLALGKPLGIALFCVAAVGTRLCQLPVDLTWRHIVGAGMLAGIGFTMSIFIANLAFPTHPEIVDSSKVAILAGSLVSALLGFIWLRAMPRPG